MHFLNLNSWLHKIQSLHVTDMDLSLERVSEVFARLDLPIVSCPVVTVAGTNGKGSCVAGLEAIYLKAGYRVGAFTSPILFRHNEYVRIQGVPVSDELFCTSFELIETVRGNISLTQFEFNTLAAFVMFYRANCEVWLLEVGLGGRFDAVNIIDADVAIVTSIGIDHVDWLGDTREKIAYEKAGIFRSNKPVIYGDFDPPRSIIHVAREIGAPVFYQGQQFGFKERECDWEWWSEKTYYNHLSLPQLALQNISIVLKAVELLQQRLPVSPMIIQEALKGLKLPGRIEVFPGDVTTLFDVSHNPHAAELLAKWLVRNPIKGKTHAVFSMLADKDILGTIKVMQAHIFDWHIASLPVKRGASLEVLEQIFQLADIKRVFSYKTIEEAYKAAINISQPGDGVIVFGSFHVVAEAACALNARECIST